MRLREGSLARLPPIYNRVSILATREETNYPPLPGFVIAGIYKQYQRGSIGPWGFPKRNMVIRAMAHIDMNDARH